MPPRQVDVHESDPYLVADLVLVLQWLVNLENDTLILLVPHLLEHVIPQEVLVKEDAINLGLDAREPDHGLVHVECLQEVVD